MRPGSVQKQIQTLNSAQPPQISLIDEQQNYQIKTILNEVIDNPSPEGFWGKGFWWDNPKKKKHKWEPQPNSAQYHLD